VPVEANLRNRAWVLGLVVLANQAGLRPISKKQLHSLVFLANGLATIYSDEGVENRVVKHVHGPFYPDAQWDLDRMVGQGLLQISDIRFSDDDGHWWMDANFKASALGRKVYAQCRAEPMLARSYRFLVELVNAFASLTRDAQNTAPLFDAIYAAPGHPEWSPIVFEDAQDNFSAQTAASFDGMVGPDIRLAPKERLQLYFGYLGLMAEKKAGVAQ
jgi:hypothetical protein